MVKNKYGGLKCCIDWLNMKTSIKRSIMFFPGENLSLLPNLTLKPTHAQTSNVSMGNDYGVKARIISD